MSFLLQAPAPDIQTTSILPSPVFNDSESKRASVSLRRSMNNTKRSYVKSSTRSRVSYSFNLARMKGEELRNFILAYYRAKLRWTDHLGDVWEGYFTINPFEFSGAGRAAGSPGSETVDVTLQMEGERTSYGPRNQC